MTLGTGIFLSTLVVSTLLLYRWTRDRWNYKKIFIRGVGLLSILILIGWCYNLYDNRLVKQTEYYSISLGMNKGDVLYVKGKPYEVYNTGKFGGTPLIKTKVENIEVGKSAKDFDNWDYHPKSYDNDFVTIKFNEQGVVTEIACTSNGWGCESVLDISSSSSEEDVRDKLGLPSNEVISGGFKGMSYPELNLHLYLRQKKVYILKVIKQKKVRYWDNEKKRLSP